MFQKCGAKSAKDTIFSRILPLSSGYMPAIRFRTYQVHIRNNTVALMYLRPHHSVQGLPSSLRTRKCQEGQAAQLFLEHLLLPPHPVYGRPHLQHYDQVLIKEQTAYEESNIEETFSWATIFSLITLSRVGRGDCTETRALAAHRCGPGSIPKHSVTYGLNLLFVLVLVPTVFFRSFGFPPQHKPTFQIQISVGSIE